MGASKLKKKECSQIRGGKRSHCGKGKGLSTETCDDCPTPSSPRLPSGGAPTVEPSDIPESRKDPPFKTAPLYTKHTVPKEVLVWQAELRFSKVSQCSLLRTRCIICKGTFCWSFPKLKAWKNKRGIIKLEETLAVYLLSLLPKKISLAKGNSFIIQKLSLGIIYIKSSSILGIRENTWINQT